MITVVQLWYLAVQRGAGARTVTIDIVTQHAYNHTTVTPQLSEPQLSGSSIIRITKLPCT